MTEKEKMLIGAALDLAESTKKRFEFVFEGTEDQFRFFKSVVLKKVPSSGITLDDYTNNGFHCSMPNNCETAFKVGMIVSACYAHFGHLKDNQF